MELSEHDITRLLLMQIENQHRAAEADINASVKCACCGDRWPCERGLLLEGLRRSSVALLSDGDYVRHRCDQCDAAAEGFNIRDVRHEDWCPTGAAVRVLAWADDDSVPSDFLAATQPEGQG